MLGRLVFLAAVVYTILYIAQSKTKRQGISPEATARWESEGGSSASELVG
jgi:hypothetical protein